MATSFENWRHSVGVCMNLYFQSKFQGSKLGPILALLEPLELTFALIFIRTVIRDGGYYGPSMILFYASGILPYYLFLFVSLRTCTMRFTPSLAMPGRSALDYLLAVAVVEASIVFALLVSLFGILWLSGVDAAIPVSIGDCLFSLLLLFLLGLGIGLINMVISSQLPIWPNIYGVLTRGMMFFSGVFIMVDTLPLNVRNIVQYVPMYHAIDWFRVGVYGSFPAMLLNLDYLFSFVLAVVFLGMVLERSSLRMRLGSDR
jgi:capsular polysaccharide transport system permease protein